MTCAHTKKTACWTLTVANFLLAASSVASGQDIGDLLKSAVDGIQEEAPLKPREKPRPSAQTIALGERLSKLIEERHSIVDRTGILRNTEDLFGTNDFTRWQENYNRMRIMLRHDHTAPENDHFANLIRTSVEERPDFIEGRVLLLLFDIYAGEHQEALTLLPITHNQLKQANLDKTFLILDFCYASLLLRSNEANEALNWLSSIGNLKRPAIASWLIARAQMLSPIDGQRRLARKNFVRAIATAEREKIDVESAAPLYGDAALLYLTSPRDEDRSITLAKAALNRLEDSDAPTCWMVTRARAALHAQEGNWALASSVLEDAIQQCPPHLAHEFVSQQTAYKQERLWFTN